MDINPNAPLIDRHSILIDAPRSTIWQLLTNINDWPRWQHAITRAQLDGPLALETVFRWTAGGMAIVSTLHDIEPQKRLAWTGKALGTTTEHVWSLEETATGTLITTSESMSGWLIYPVKLVTPRFLADALQTWLTALKHAAEPQTEGVGARLEGPLQ